MAQDKFNLPVVPSTACLSGEKWVQPLAVGERRPKALYCHILSKRLVSKSGGRVVSGWQIETSLAQENWYCVLTHHSVVARPNGVLVDPSHHGQAPWFLPDPDRPYNFDNLTGYNSILVASESFELLGEHYPANVPVWVRFDHGKIQDASLDEKHSRFRTTYGPEDVTRALSELGFELPSMRDALFCSTMHLTRPEPGDLPRRLDAVIDSEALA